MFRTLMTWLLRLLGLGPNAPPPPAPPAPAPAPLRPHAETLGAPLSAAPVVPGGSAPIPIVIPQFIAPDGWYPSSIGDTESMFTLGMIHATMPDPGAPFASPVFDGIAPQGQVLPVAGHQQLVSLVLGTYGGELPGTFGLPDLRGKAIVGPYPPADLPPDTLQLTWLVATTSQPGNPVAPGNAAAPLAGMMMPFLGTSPIDGWLACDGSAIASSAYPELAAVLATSYGTAAAGQTILPNMGGKVASGAGGRFSANPGTTALGSFFGEFPLFGLCITYLICVRGNYPSQTGGAFPSNQPWLGQIVAYAGPTAPTGWAVCDGSLLQIEQNMELFALVGSTYGGDGEETFALPDLRSAMIVGAAAT